ncbi:accessory gene regulator ArgB-like protein [Pseudobacteroides cellulosolvens]|uniref:Accessory protein regulator B n=1 Tax=Pseudobacteroides cellulosolvens ATCC 35603 = DSM 2933 TaxID=398512 RepID=A0A0L6JHX7_9FIRM|nr:accessory gene regulator B family protein [Pseudobacteroides cellulosolvens]KNY25087.1 Accessory protein regulator B [Pseudobacteroides cellulosolvens ATCC 35603 = DSM 2933]
MIDKLSDTITKKIRENNKEITDEKAEIITYGANIIIFQTIITALIMIIAFFLGVFTYAFISFIIVGLLRSTVGGSHSHTRLQCTLMHSFSIFGTIILSNYIKFNSYYPAIFLLLISIFVILKYAPGETINGPLYSNSQKRSQKTAGITIETITFCIGLFVKNIDLQAYYIIIISSFIPIIFLTPLGYIILGCKRC